MKMLLQWPLL
jgi:hypothetical protein